MSMVTQCPHCTTAFNVTPEQLFARDGRVRCGVCRQVFDGLVQLTSLEALEAGVPPPLAEATDAEVQASAASLTAQARPSPGFAPLNWPMVPEVPVVPVPQIAMPPAESVARSADDGATGAAHANDAPQSADTPVEPVKPVESIALAALAKAEPYSPAADTVSETQTAPSRARWLWAAAAALAAVALCGQLLHSFRSEIAAYVPRVRPALAQLCEWAHCSVPPLQQPQALEIQASDLLILDKTRPHLVQLIVTLQNKSAIDVAYPAIDLALNDRFDHVVARRVFLPGDYLRGIDAQKTVIASSVTTTVRIDLDVSGLSAGGFNLLLIPAPQT